MIDPENQNSIPGYESPAGVLPSSPSSSSKSMRSVSTALRILASLLVMFSLAVCVTLVLYCSAYAAGRIIYQPSESCSATFSTRTRALPQGWETFPPRFYETCSAPGKVSLTFDDGPVMTLNATNFIIDTLNKAGVKGSFFLSPKAFDTGTMEEKCELVKRIVSEGHFVGSHSWTHPNLTPLSQEAFLDEVFTAETWIEQCSGKRPTHFRPPFGELTLEQGRMLSALGYVVSFWNFDTNDWTHPNNYAEIVQEVEGEIARYRDTHNEDRESVVLLQHDYRSVTIPDLVANFKVQFEDYEFVRADGCFIDAEAAPDQCLLMEEGEKIATACVDRNRNHYQVASWGFRTGSETVATNQNGG